MPARFSSALSTSTSPWDVLMAASSKYLQTIPDGLNQATPYRLVDPSGHLVKHAPVSHNRKALMHMHYPIQVRRDTRAWKAQVWISFGLAAGLCAIGLAYLPGRDLDRAFMVMGYVFC